MRTLKESILDNINTLIKSLNKQMNSALNIKVSKWQKQTYIYAGIDLSDLNPQDRNQLWGDPVGGLGFKIAQEMDFENIYNAPKTFFSIDLLFITKEFANSDKVSDNHGGGHIYFSLISYDEFRNNPKFADIASMPLPKLKKYLIDRLKHIIINIDKYKKILGDIYSNVDKNTWHMAEENKIKILIG